MNRQKLFSTSSANGRSTRYEHALVIGGSMAGLLAARVLADHVDRVTIIERDHLPADPAFRPGVPQMRHNHVLLARGQQILETLFPGLGTELAAAGAQSIDWCADLERSGPPGPALRFASDIQIYTCSRELLEWCVRRRVARHPHIHFHTACRVTDLVFDEQGMRVIGVQMSPRSTTPDDQTTPTRLLADLVVDASGRNSRAPRWLAAHGYPTPTETIIDSHVGYATRYYEPDPTFQQNWKGMAVYTRTHGAGILPLEQGQWSVLLTGIGEHAPPNDEAGFLAFIQNLNQPDIYAALQHAQPISPIYGYRRTENRWRHYERLTCQPDNFLVLGDAVCALNPTYGQGMTNAALGAITLDRCLRQQRRGNHYKHQARLAARFQRQLARNLRDPWMLATSADRSAARTEEDTRFVNRLVHAYMDQLYMLTRRNRHIALARYHVIHLLKPPISLFYPGMALPVIGYWIRTGLARLRAPRNTSSSHQQSPDLNANGITSVR